MGQEQIIIQVGEEKRKYPFGTTFLEVAKDFADTKNDDIILAESGNRLFELCKKIKYDCEIRFITTAEKVGYDTYRRSVTLLMLKAMDHVAGHDNIEKISVHFSVGSGYYCTLKGKIRLTEQLLKEVKAYMRELVEQKIPIQKRSEDTYKAIELFHEYGMYDKEALLTYRRVSKVNIYNLAGFEDYFYGYMAPDTSYLRYFDLVLYDEGFVLLFPWMSNPRKVPEFQPRKKIFQVQKQTLLWGEMLNVPTVAALNERVVNGNMDDLILCQEALQEKKIGEIAEQIAKKKARIVLIAGPSSSGKTTFSHRLSIQLAAHGLNPHPIPMDDYFVDREKTPLDIYGDKNFECLEAIDIELFNEDMTWLLSGEKVELPYYNFKLGKREYRGDILRLGKDDVLVIEGIHGLNDRMTYRMPREEKFKIYISGLTQLNVDEHNRIATTDGRLLRRIIRDARTRGTSAKNTIAMWTSVGRGEEAYIFPYQEEADVMFNSALIYELAVLKIYAEPLLFGIAREEPEYKEAKRLLKFLDYFVGIPGENVPQNSILREFIGGSCFKV